MYQRKVDVDMLNTVKSVLANVSSVSTSSEQRDISFGSFPEIAEKYKETVSRENHVPKCCIKRHLKWPRGSKPVGSKEALVSRCFDLPALIYSWYFPSF